MPQPQPQPSPSTRTWIWAPSTAPYSPRGLLPYSFTPSDSFTPPALPTLQPSPSVPMPSTRLEMSPFTSTATQVGGSSLSVLEDTEWLKKVLRGVSKCAYVMLRCALACNRTLNSILNGVYPTQPQRRHVGHRSLQQQSSHEGPAHDRHHDVLLCCRPSLAPRSTTALLQIGPSLRCSISRYLTLHQLHHVKRLLALLVAFLSLSVLATLFALAVHSWTQIECSSYCWAERTLVSTIMIGGFASLMVGVCRMKWGDGWLAARVDWS
jgi:hypothetical protein